MCTIISWCRQADTLQLSVGAEPQGLSDAAAQTEGRWWSLAKEEEERKEQLAVVHNLVRKKKC